MPTTPPTHPRPTEATTATRGRADAKLFSAAVPGVVCLSDCPYLSCSHDWRREESVLRPFVARERKRKNSRVVEKPKRKKDSSGVKDDGPRAAERRLRSFSPLT